MILCMVCRSPNLYTKAENLYVCNDCGNEWEQFTPKVYAVDFDGYLCKSAWPDIGEPNMDIIEHFKALKAEGHKLILWTCREGEMLQKAIDWCAEWELYFDAHNANLPELIEKYGNNCRKIGADYYCDDKNYWLMPKGIIHEKIMANRMGFTLRNALRDVPCDR